MFFDARNIEKGSVLETDVCILGGGAAGITLAREFDGVGKRIMLLEGGGFNYTRDSQDLYSGKNVGLPYVPLDITRLRYFGGSTNHWAGHCRPLDESDFEVRDWVPSSGWPLTKPDLDPYYKRAHEVLQLAAYEYDVGYWERELNQQFVDMGPVTGIRPAIFQRSGNAIAQGDGAPTTRFGKKYQDELRASRNVEVYVNANAVKLITDANATRVNQVDVAVRPGIRFRVRAAYFILATGGLEVPRLLLVSNDINGTGIGNQYDLVGRYFMEHLQFRPFGTLVFAKRIPRSSLFFGDRCSACNDGPVFAALAPTTDRMRMEGLTNFRIDLVPRDDQYSDWQYSYRVLKTAAKHGVLPDNLGSHVGSMIKHMDDLLIEGYCDVVGLRRNRSDQTPANPVYADLGISCEPIPNRESRVTLSDDLDAFGKRKIILNWQINDQDIQIMKRAMEIGALKLGELGIGRVNVPMLDVEEWWHNHLEGGHHHSGTARMSSSPKEGVVDKHCRVHDIANLYVASSAVFSTVGYANPTLTIVALAIRVADHIKRYLV